MVDFFKFPHTPHLAWLGKNIPRDDKIMRSSEVEAFLEKELVMEEKLDGANLGLSISSYGELLIQNRGQYLSAPYTGQFEKLKNWFDMHASLEESLSRTLGQNLILFGEWCAARHSLEYNQLPDWFLVFDVYDRTKKRFWSTSRRNQLAEEAHLKTVPLLSRTRTTLEKLKYYTEHQVSLYYDGPLEGVILRQETENWLKARAKLVRSEFANSITEHWSRGGIIWNRVSYQTA